MAQTILHFVFTVSGGGCLVQALRKAGRDDQVVVTSHNMQFGPIDPGDLASRAKWIENELGFTDCDRTSPSDRVWNEARFPDNRKVVWLTRRSAMEYAGFLDWLWVRGDQPCEVVDLTGVNISSPPEFGPPRPTALAMSLALLNPDTIRHNKLWDLAKPLQTTERRRYRELWERLRSENAPLRVIDGDKLVSAPVSFFDSLLMSYVTDQWQKVSMIFSWITISHWDDDIWQTNDTFLAVRMHALVKSGRLEIRGGTALEIVLGEVRLSRARG